MKWEAWYMLALRARSCDGRLNVAAGDKNSHRRRGRKAQRHYRRDSRNERRAGRAKVLSAIMYRDILGGGELAAIVGIRKSSGYNALSWGSLEGRRLRAVSHH